MFLCEQPVTSQCIRSPPKMGKTSRTFFQFIWMQFSSLVYENKISGEIQLHRCTLHIAHKQLE